MNDLLHRRRAMMEKKSDALNTSTKIAEYGKGCALAVTGERLDAKLGITEWYQFDPKRLGRVTLLYHSIPGNVRYDANYQFYAFGSSESDIGRDWFYSQSSQNPTRNIGWENRTLQEIRFTITTKDVNDVYAYVVETGQIFFAGKNTPYYGYTNINDMPQG